jgi:hypothetical protein
MQLSISLGSWEEENAEILGVSHSVLVLHHLEE